MQTLFRYNWLVREDWYRWCEEIPEEELLRIRIGGVGGILQTLFHIIDVGSGAGFSPCRENQAFKKILRATRGWKRSGSWMRHSTWMWKGLCSLGM